jgi:mRNA interferase MazF
MAGAIARGEVRLYRFAAPDKQRPPVVLTREGAIDYLGSLTVAPVTSSIRSVPSEVMLTTADGMKNACVVNLHNIITVSKADLGKRVATLGPERLNEICTAINFCLGCR